MISFALALLLLATSSVAQPKKALNACLDTVTREKLKEKAPAEAFDAALSSACSAERAALRQAIISERLAAKVKRTDAEEIAAGDTEDMLINAKEMYRAYLETGSVPR
jgi:hypothetical protein